MLGIIARNHITHQTRCFTVPWKCFCKSENQPGVTTKTWKSKTDRDAAAAVMWPIWGLESHECFERWKTFSADVCRSLPFVCMMWDIVCYALRQWRFRWKKDIFVRRHTVCLCANFSGGPLWLISVFPQGRQTSRQSLSCKNCSKDAYSSQYFDVT